MNTFDFLQQLRQQDIELRREGDKLKVNAPKGAITADIANTIKTHKADILTFLAEAEQAQQQLPTAVPPLQPIPRPAHIPLSFGQERLWRLHQLALDSSFYNIPYVYRLRGTLHIEALRQAVHAVVARHEALRTTFSPPEQQDGVPTQIVHDHVDFEMPLFDFSDTAVSDEVRAEKARQKLSAIAHQPYDLSQDTLLRTALVRLAPDEHLFLFAPHHIIFDGWSAAIFKQDLRHYYTHYVQGTAPRLPALTVQPADFALWQRAWLTPEELDHQLDYWRTHLAGSPEPLQLPADRVPTTAASSEGQLHLLKIEADTYTAVKQAAQQAQVSPFMFLFAAFNTLLHRYSGQTDLLVATPIAGRPHKELEALIGYFNNLIILRSDLSQDPSFAALLTRLKAVVMGGLDHQEVPFQAVASLPTVVRVPLTRALFAMEEEEQPLALPNLTAEKNSLGQRTADFDLAFFLNEQTNGYLHVLMLYKTDLFSAEAITKLGENFVSLLTAVSQAPHQPLSQLPLRHDPAPLICTVPSPAQASPARGRGEHIAPRTDTEQLLAHIWQEVLQLDGRQISVTDNFFDLGGHSLLALRLFEKITLATGQNLPLATLLHAPTIADLAAVLESRNDDPNQSSSVWSSLVPIQPQGDLPPLFFIHAHGGNVVGYYDLGRHLDDNQPLYGLQAHGLSGDVPLLTNFEEMAAHYIAEMRRVQPHGPYFVGGWCLGGYVSFEIAHQLTAQGEQVAFIGLFEAPHPDYDAVAHEQGGLSRVMNRTLDRWDTETGRLAEVDAEKRIAYLSNRTRRLLTTLQTTAVRKLGTDTVTPTVQASALAKIEEVHENAFRAYEWRPYHGRVTIFRAEKQPRGRPDDPTLGWHNWVTGEIEVQNIPGTRIGMLEEPRVTISAARITASLVRARAWAAQQTAE